MRYILRKEFLLRGWDGHPNGLVDTRDGSVRFIRPEFYKALELCDGSIDFSLPFIPEKTKKAVAVLLEEKVIEPAEKGDALLEKQRYIRYQNRYIYRAHWSITGRCNYRCKHCYMSAPEARYGELSQKEILQIVDELAACGIFQVSLTGGEPLVRADFFDIVDALLEKGISISQIYSNGALVNEGFLEKLEKRGIYPEINMSFDGWEDHDWLRGVSGAREKVKGAFLLCRDKGFPTGAEMCLYQDNKDSLSETIQLLSQWRCRSLKVSAVFNSGAWKEGEYGKSLEYSEVYQSYLDCLPDYFQAGRPLALQLGALFYCVPERKEIHIPASKSCMDPERFALCGHARQTLYISPEGRALPCMSLSGNDLQEQFPSILKKGLSACLQDSFYTGFVDATASQYLASNPQCETCKHSRQCVGGCRASALEFEQDILGPDRSVCELYKGGWKNRLLDLLKEISHT